MVLFSPPNFYFNGVCKSKEILLNLGMKCLNITFNAQGSKVFMVFVDVRTMKINITIVEMLKKGGVGENMVKGNKALR